MFHREIWKQLAAATVHVISARYNINAGASMVFGGNIPIGCGLSSSSAYVISIVQSICYLFKIQMEDRQLARLCQKIENRALGTASWLLDQYGIIFSRKDHLIIIDFQDDTIEYIPLSLNG